MIQPRFQPLPPLSDEERAALKDNIATHGQQVPILRDEHGNVIDGHNREQICLELGLEPKYETRYGLTDDEKWELAESLNAVRRQLTPDQKRAMIVTELNRNRERTDRQIATSLGVDPRTVQRQRHLLFDPPDPVIPDPRVIPAWIKDLDECTSDYPHGALSAAEESVADYEKYVLWCGERLIAYLQQMPDWSPQELLMPLMVIKYDGLALYDNDLFPWERYPQADAIHARLSRVLDKAFEAQNDRIDLMSEEQEQAWRNDANRTLEWEQQRWNVYRWRRLYLIAARESLATGKSRSEAFAAQVGADA